MRFIGFLLLIASIAAYNHARALGVEDWRWDTFFMGVLGFVLLFPNLTFGLFGDSYGKRK